MTESAGRVVGASSLEWCRIPCPGIWVAEQGHVGLRFVHMLDSCEVLLPLSVGRQTSYTLLVFLSESHGR